MALRHAGTQTLQTARLTLRKLREEDAPSVYRHWTTDPAIYWEPHTSIDQTENSLAFWGRQYAQSSHYQWGIARKTDDQIIGGITVMNNNELTQTCELVCNISQYHSDKGYLAEALREVIRFLLHTVGYKQLLAAVEAGGNTHAHTLEEAGMSQIGIRRAHGGRNAAITRIFAISR